MKIGFYDPYLETLGGGEKYLLTIVEEAVRSRKHEVALFSPTAPDPAAWRRLDIRVPERSFTWEAATEQTVPEQSLGLDLLVVLHNEVPPRSFAKRSVAIIQFPFRARAFGRKRDFLRPIGSAQLRRGQQEALDSYDRFVCYSLFVKDHIARRLGATAAVIPPPVDLPGAAAGRKGRSIIAVGRFFRGGHNKKHDVMIQAFAELLKTLDPNHGWELHLVGGAKDDPDTKSYLVELRKLAEGLPVRFHVNADISELRRLYRQAAVFWHAAGYGENVGRFPERLEHFGITTVEAMSYGCVPVVIGLGGQLEIIRPGKNGFLWRTPAELVGETKRLIDNPKDRETMARTARHDAKRFGKPAFLAMTRKQILAV